MLLSFFLYDTVYAQVAGASFSKIKVLSPQVIAQVQQNFGRRSLLNQVAHSVVQISRPGVPEVLGTGFVFRAHNRLWVAMPYHIGGVAGSRRVIRFAGKNNQPQELEITIAVNGNAGWHAPDVSLAEFPREYKSFVKPLTIGSPQVNSRAFSFGYVAGREAGLEELLPIRRFLFSTEGFGVISNRHIVGEDPTNPFNISGYCGAPVVQWINGSWRAVALHTGSCMMPNGRMRAFAVNLPRVVPLLLNRYLDKKKGFSRNLVFRGWDIGQLLPSERVHSVEVWRNGERIFYRLLRNFPGPYSDEHSELALEDFDLLHGDELRYQIRNNQREMRFISYVLP